MPSFLMRPDAHAQALLSILAEAQREAAAAVGLRGESARVAMRDARRAEQDARWRAIVYKTRATRVRTVTDADYTRQDGIEVQDDSTPGFAAEATELRRADDESAGDSESSDVASGEREDVAACDESSEAGGDEASGVEDDTR